MKQLKENQLAERNKNATPMQSNRQVTPIMDR